LHHRIAAIENKQNIRNEAIIIIGKIIHSPHGLCNAASDQEVFARKLDD
jgi:hypothetical protein